MDLEKEALFSWIALVFMRCGSRPAGEPKLWLPDLPHLSHILLDSDGYVLSDACLEEILLLGVSANFIFADYLENHHILLPGSGSSVANPIVLDDYTDTASICESRPTALRMPRSQSL
ncbi:hypothetical protein KC19_VG260100 [Ceratodon purpureus]|uniref:Uncharacterized protein n=1 Tax=Ceratodon purpureus TaxID=3225 RepID=A0A8T0HV48_CERPU|nr:hypothetical protein KC19_VG260100 [Ceratodon purpureus]